MNSSHLPVAIVLASLIIAGALIYTSGPSTGGVGSAGLGMTGDHGGTPQAADRADITVTEEDHIRGAVNAAVTIVEYSDLECPFCSRFHPTVLRALDEYPGQVRWVYRHFPLSIHPNAQGSAEASECVAEQAGDDGFWEFVDAMFENQDRLGSAYYRDIAGQIGVNLSEFDSCVSSGRHQDTVREQQASGLQLGVNGTPGSFVNGRSVRGAVPYETLQAIIEEELAN